MIDAKELRIGNIVIASGLHGGEIRTIDQITGKGTLRDESRVIFFKEDGIGEFAKDLDGLPLTPELLVDKCGFEKENGKQNIFRLDRLKLWLETGCLCYLKNEDDEFCQYIPNGGITSLHQLQNLYLALTGKELEINNL